MKRHDNTKFLLSYYDGWCPHSLPPPPPVWIMFKQSSEASEPCFFEDLVWLILTFDSDSPLNK